MQDARIVTITIIMPASLAQALARWLQDLTLDDYLAHAIDRQHAFDAMCAVRLVLDELIAELHASRW